MYKNFTITESEREEILNSHKEYGYRQPLNEQSMDEADVNAVAGKVTSIQQGMKYFFDNLSKLEYGQWYNVPNDPLAGKADVYNEQRMLGGAAGGGIMTCDNGRRMFYRKANPETPQQKKLYFFIKYDREVGPNGPVPRVYWMWSSGGSETPLSIVSVAGAQDVLKKLSMMGLNEQMDMGGFKEGPGEKPKPDVDHFNKIVKPQLLNAGFKLSDDKSLSPYGTRLSLIYGDHNTGVNVIYFQPQGKSWLYKVWVGNNKNYKEFPLGGINDVQKTATNVVNYALSLKGTPTQYNEEESMDEQIGGGNDKAQGDVFKRFPQNSNQNQSQQTKPNTQQSKNSGLVNVKVGSQFLLYSNKEQSLQKGGTPYTIVFDGPGKKVGFDKSTIEFPAHMAGQSNGTIQVHCSLDKQIFVFDKSGGKITAYGYNKDITNQFCSGPTPTQYNEEKN